MYKRDLQREIRWREERDTKQADTWLRSEGIAPETLAQIDSQLVKAQRIAHNCITHHRELLTAKELDTLTRYLQSMQTRKTRRRIKAKRTYEVMNIGNRINKQLFRQLRQMRQVRQLKQETQSKRNQTPPQANSRQAKS
jgi:hypothetical protein